MIDYKELSPLFALAGGSVIVLMVGLLGSRFARAVIVPVLTRGGAPHRHRPHHLDLGAGQPRPDPRGRAGRGHARARHVDALLRGGPRDHRAVAALAGHRAGRPRRVPLAAARVDRGHGRAGRGGEPDDAVHRVRAALDPALRPVRDAPAPAHLARGRAEVPGGGIGGLGHAAVRPGAGLRRHRGAGVRRDRDGARQRRRERVGPAAAHRRRALRDRPRVQGVGGALPPVDAGRLPGRPHADHDLHGRGHQGGRVRGVHPSLRPRVRARPARLGPGARRARRGDHRDRQRRARSRSAR